VIESEDPAQLARLCVTGRSQRRKWYFPPSCDKLCTHFGEGWSRQVRVGEYGQTFSNQPVLLQVIRTDLEEAYQRSVKDTQIRFDLTFVDIKAKRTVVSQDVRYAS
jgi:hypothetical protein